MKSNWMSLLLIAFNALSALFLYTSDCSSKFNCFKLAWITLTALKFWSTNITLSIPLESASIPKAPLPANKSKPKPYTSCKLLKIPSLTLSIVGRVLRPSKLSSGLLLCFPAMTLILTYTSISFIYLL